MIKRGIALIELNDDKCMHCGACVGACPANAIYLNEVILDFNDDCTDCGLCVKACPVGALTLIRTRGLKVPAVTA